MYKNCDLLSKNLAENLMDSNTNETSPFMPIASPCFELLTYEQSLVDGHQRLYNLVYKHISDQCGSLSAAECRDVVKRRMVAGLYKFLDTVKK